MQHSLDENNNAFELIAVAHLLLTLSVAGIRPWARNLGRKKHSLETHKVEHKSVACDQSENVVNGEEETGRKVNHVRTKLPSMQRLFC